VSRDPRDVELDALRAQLREVLARLDVSLAQNAALVEQVAKLNERIAELLPIAKRKKSKPRPKTSEPQAPPPKLDAAAQKAFDERPRPPAKPDKPRPAERSAKPSGRKPVPGHLEAETHVLRPDACAQCGGTKLDAVDDLLEVKLHVVKEHQRRRVVNRKTCRCRACGERTTPRSLPAPYERSKVTCEWLAWLVYSKFVLLMPLDRIRRDLAERGVHLAMGTLVSLIERAADILAPVDGVHWKSLLAGPWMATDGTGLKVLVPEMETAHNGYIELYRREDLAVFQYEADKAAENMLSKMRSFRGTLLADAEHRFNALYETGCVVEAGCNAHARRKFRDAEGAQPMLAVEGGAFLGAMYGQEARAKELGLTEGALRAHRQIYIRPIADEFLAWMNAVEPTLLPTDPLAQAIRYCKNHRAALLRFIEDPALPIDNSPTERLFQNVAKLRLNMLFAGSTEGAHRACVLLGITATCRAIGVPALAYLTWAFERLGTHRDLYGLDAADLTPAAFKRQA